MSAYVLIDFEVTDPEGFKEYRPLATPSVSHYGGKLLAGRSAPTILEGEWHIHQLSIGEFASLEQALAWYNSEEYAPAKAIRLRTTRSKVMIVPGV